VKNFVLLTFICLCILSTSGCVAVGVGGTTLAIKGLPRAELEQLANQGNSQAQYELGLSHCCMGVGFSTQTATEWLCKAAAQEHPAAMYELGRIYLGEISRTPAPGQKLLRMAVAKESPPHAYMWFTKASALGEENATQKLSQLESEMTDQEKQKALVFLADWQKIDCLYDAIFKRETAF